MVHLVVSLFAVPDGRPSPPTARAGDLKLAERVATLIETEVIRAGWPVGQIIGTEEELAVRFAVSRAVVREAIRLVEHRQIAGMRRGRNGGLVVVAPDASAVIESLAIYSGYIRVTLDDLLEARLMLESFSVTVAADRLDENALLVLRQAVTDEAESQHDTVGRHSHRIHEIIAEVTGNEALALFVRAAISLTDRHLRGTSPKPTSTRVSGREVHRAHAAIVQAVIAGDGHLARHRMLKHMAAFHQAVVRRLSVQAQTHSPNAMALAPDDDPTGTAIRRPADILAGQIRNDIILRGWPVGERLGFEADLVDRYNIGRAQLREAIRILENHSVVRMQRGIGGGMVVDAPDGSAVVRAVSLYLRYRGLNTDHMYELREAIESATLRLAVERLSDEGIARLNATIERERTWPDDDFRAVSHDLHAVIAELSGNRVLPLLLSVLVSLTAEHLRKPHPGRASEPPDSTRHAHRAIVAAIVAGDAPLAWRRMRIHLNALAKWPDR